MAALAPGILQKLIQGMETGIKPTGEHRSSVLQVTDIVPVDLDKKNLVPKHGFLIKLSDSSHSIYVTLPPDQDDVVLSNKMQLGQFIHVDHLEPGSPPIVKGAKPIPGRHPLVRTTEPVMCLKMYSQEPASKPRRGSWGQIGDSSSPFVLKPLPLDFNNPTPAKRFATAKFTASPTIRGRSAGRVRFSFGGGVSAKTDDLKGESPPMLRKSCAVPTDSKFPRSTSVCDRETKINASSVLSPFISSAKKNTSPPPNLRSGRDEGDAPLSTSKMASTKQESQHTKLIKPKKSTNLLGRLNTLSKEAAQIRETAQKIALQALREATPTESLVRSIKTFASLTKTAKADCPAACFEKFMELHHEMAHTRSEIASIEAAGLDSANRLESINTRDESQKPTGKDSRSSSKIVHNSVDQKRWSILKQQNDENKNPISGISNTSRLAKEIEDEAANWFMEFIEMALEKGMEKSRDPAAAYVKTVPQSLILKVLNWVEVEHSDDNNTRRTVHPKASKITRKLRIKMKNP